MGKHTPLPSDPDAKAAEKKRRFKIYYREWRRRRAAESRADRVLEARTQARQQREEDRAEQERRQAWRRQHNYDLIGL